MNNKLLVRLERNKTEIKMNPLEKSIEDTINFKDDSYHIAICGTILNADSLYKKNGLKEYVINNINKRNYNFFSKFRGNFCGVVNDRLANKSYAFTDHFGTEALFYYWGGDYAVISTSALGIVQYLKKQGVTLPICKVGAYQLLTYGFMMEDYTLYEGIKRIIPGEMIFFSAEGVCREKYYEIKNQVITTSEQEAIETIDILFMKAVELQARKNTQNGFENYAALSAGLDSRIVCFALKRLGYEDVKTFTYSQSNELDDIYPKKMASDLKYEWIFKNLDNGLDMLAIDESVDIGDGIQYYLWPAQLNGFLKRINTDRLGIVHTGVIGDVVVGSFYRQYSRKDYSLGDGAYSRTLLSKLRDIYQPGYYDYEIGMLYNRGINGASSGYLTSFRQCCEPISPFMNVELFDYCLSLPIAMKISHRLYYKWVLEKYPEAAVYPHNGLKIKTSKAYVKLHDRPIPINGIVDRVISNYKSKFGHRLGMNPVEYWYQTNETLRSTLDNYFNQFIDMINDKDVKADTISLYQKGTVIEKAMCLTLIGTVKLMNCEC